jgi:opacity protein-like surface antigen
MKKFIMAAMVLVCAAAFVPEASAQGLGLGPQVGFHKAKDADEGKLMGGLALRMKLTPALGVEGSINYRQEKFNDETLTVRSWPVMVTGLFYPVPVAYGAIGAGWYNTKFDYTSSDGASNLEETQQEFGWHFGGGVELPLGASTKLAGDVRYVFLNYNFDKVPGAEVECDFYVITMGLLFGL